MNHQTNTYSAAEAKRLFADLLGRVAYGGETIVIERRGKPMAKLVPVDREFRQLAQVQGWLDDDDPFFDAIDQAVQARSAHIPRVLGVKKSDPGKSRRRSAR